ncbi:MAG: hypothetical protein ACE5EX_11225 [Phycisphaerae bacterium]
MIVTAGRNTGRAADYQGEQGLANVMLSEAKHLAQESARFLAPLEMTMFISFLSG